VNALLLGAGAGAGLWLILVALSPARTSLAETLAVVLTPPAATKPATYEAGWAGKLGRPMTGFLEDLGLPSSSVRRDLLVTGHPVQQHLAEKAAATVLGLVLLPICVALMALAGVSVPLAIPAWGALLMAAAGFVTPDLALRSQARERRADLRHALGSFLDLVVVALAGGSGIDAAMDDASKIGSGWAYQQLRQALHRSRIARVAPWQALGRLGEELDVPELSELAASVALAGNEGAKVRASLTAKAASLRSRELSDGESGAQSATERMSLPVVLLFGGFFAFIVYPAVVHVGTAL
jgi:tight adherence protein C